MSSMTQAEFAEVEVVDESAPQFFAPVASDVVDSLLGQYGAARVRIEQLVGYMAGGLSDVLHYFIEGNAGDDRMHRSLYLDRLFERDGALKALDSAYWSKALALTDVYDCMPQARRDEWNKSIREHKAPEFTEDTVRSTLTALLASRQKFFAEKVDGIFRNLSRSHVTNCPEGFSRRMIIERVVDEYGYTSSGPCGYINDLRTVIARFMGRDEPCWSATSPVIKMARAQPGEWVTLDGGALRLRVYKKGTAHLEVHPDMACRLNQILAHLYPTSIPSAFRTQPKKRHREFEMLGRPLPFGVIGLLASMRDARERIDGGYPERYRTVPNARTFDGHPVGNVAKQAEDVLHALGAVKAGAGGRYFQFDYDPSSVLAVVVSSGCIPDTASHQFYPTPASIAEVCWEMAGIEDGDSVLEPSAGQGDLAAGLPKDRTTCVEVSALHCAILTARGFTAVEADFLTWAEEAAAAGRTFDRIVMNPPFSQGRAAAHLTAASRLLCPGGRLVAVLPGTMRNQSPLAGFDHDWSRAYADEFAGTSVCVAVLCATHVLS